MQPNKVELKIGGINGEDGYDYSQHVAFPVKWNSLLDVQLDEGFVSLVRCNVKIFKPLTPVYLRVYNEGSTVEYKKYFVVSSDNADEIPAGSGKWNHDLRLIEITKKLERIVCPSMGFVNSIKRNIPQISIEPTIKVVSGDNLVPDNYLKIKRSIISSPQKINTEKIFPSWSEVFDNDDDGYDWNSNKYIEIFDSNYTSKQTITNKTEQPNIVVNVATVIIVRYIFKYFAMQDDISRSKTWNVDYYVTFM